MARKQLSYTELRVALFVLLTVALLIVGIFYVTGQGAWQSKYTVKTYLPEANNLVAGAPVSLGGVLIGNVRRLRVNPDAKTPDQNIEIEMAIFQQDRQWVRDNSTATLVTEGALGSRYVSVTRGTPPYPIVRPGGTIKGVPATTLSTFIDRGSVLLTNLNGIAVNLRSISDQIHEGKGSLGQLLYSDKVYNEINSTVASAREIMAKINSGQGTAGKLVTSDALYNRANQTIGRVDSILAGVQAGKGSIGQLVTNRALYNNANGFLKKGNTLLANAEAGKGSLGKFVTNPALYNNIDAMSVNLRELTGKMDHGQGTFGQFFTNPQLYNNLSGLTGDLRLLIADFRQHPKRYLRIRLSIF
jgi:phospholipid/cholesterol/gamma-HCH transport system substrate-binding protein